MMNEDEIRGINCDFNYHNYGVFYEKMEEEANAAAKAAGGATDENDRQQDGEANEPAPLVSNEPLVGFTKIVSEDNLLS